MAGQRANVHAHFMEITRADAGDVARTILQEHFNEARVSFARRNVACIRARLLPVVTYPLRSLSVDLL